MANERDKVAVGELVSLPTKEKRVANFRGLLDKAAPSLAKAMPRGVNVERMMAVFFNSVTRKPDLLECNQYSVVRCLFQSAQLGVEPDTPLQHCHLIKYKNDCTLQMGYRGLIYLANNIAPSTIQTGIVYDCDKIEIRGGTSASLDHYPQLPRPEGVKPVGYYATIEQVGLPRAEYEYMTKDDVDKIRRKSRAAESGPWVTDYDQMAIKTVLKRLLKRRPASAETGQQLAKAIEIDNAAEVGDAQPFDDTIADILREEPDSKTDRLAEKVRTNGTTKAEGQRTSAQSPTGTVAMEGELPI